ncbi:response regulator [Halogeometricum borinquense]|uniref:response regulator containing CheY-like receiver domain and AraC-type DNA-binding domain n=2 Tax=Halogeometricum borinquense TaxID=60847 RepID=E4NP60_HALBP|nr:chemotaxis protein CheY [Halogeometricum borinquense]ADQ67601.1 response regulator containing CheY-like receiver domain and AraC-type DNA-binding domain [Halogeometricum borinquense DSM 11551]ELY23718.1 response regulator containing chey-like receiver domain and arac-type DNA-binding domain [Halogeometricum borinquense DSM 11551]QIB73805.1 response regulator [Halogeometricum borinquense]QIQ76837.1 response regulator [Halogeometricum borinquense]RYJ13450.1 response regulator [Halogeometricum
MASTVLVVDDSAFMRNLLKQLLDGEHEVVGEAENGVEAVEMYRELEPDVVTMDVVMPIRNGIEATTEIKSLDPNSSVIMCTSVGQEEKMREAVEAGADGYITKPFQKPNVLQAIDDVVSVEA